MRFKMTRPISISIGESLQVEIADLSKFIDLAGVCNCHPWMSVSTLNFQVKKKKKKKTCYLPKTDG